MIEIRLAPKASGASVRWREELLGLATAFLESGFADLEEVVPVVEGAPVSPGLQGVVRTGRQVWTGSVDVAPSGDGTRFSLQLCDPQRICTDLVATAGEAGPGQALARLARDGAETLGRKPAEELAASWDQPISKDPYAILLSGRAAATWYGLLPPVPEEAFGDKRRDPITRAVLVDPTVSLSQWINGRRALQKGVALGARTAFGRASLSQPQRVIFRADEAAAIEATDHPEEARRAWDLVQAKAPDQIRFVSARARSLVIDEDYADAAKLLETLPELYENDVPVLELLVTIAEKGGPAPPYDSLLARWQLAAPNDPEPVRRRVALRVKEGRYDEALSFVRTLEDRGVHEEAAKLAMSLGVAVGDFALAAKKAEELGMAATAARIRARAALAAQPAQVPPELADADEPVELVVRGGARLQAGMAAEALQDADKALAGNPWLPEALALKTEALRKLRRPDEAARSAQALRWLDPAWDVQVGTGTEPAVSTDLR